MAICLAGMFALNQSSSKSRSRAEFRARGSAAASMLVLPPQSGQVLATKPLHCRRDRHPVPAPQSHAYQTLTGAVCSRLSLCWRGEKRSDRTYSLLPPYIPGRIFPTWKYIYIYMYFEVWLPNSAQGKLFERRPLLSPIGVVAMVVYPFMRGVNRSGRTGGKLCHLV